MTAESIANTGQVEEAPAATTTARWRCLLQSTASGNLLCLLLAFLCICSLAPAASGMFMDYGGLPDFAFDAEPPASFLVSSPDEASLTCRQEDHRLQLRWRFEEIDWSTDSAVASVNASDYVGPMAESTLPFYDAGRGRLVFRAGSNDGQFVLSPPHRFQGLPKYKLYCEARSGSNNVLLSRMMLPRKMSTLRTVKAVLNCFSGPLNGSAVCRLLTDRACTGSANTSMLSTSGSRRLATGASATPALGSAWTPAAAASARNSPLSMPRKATCT
ncbi:hypothetical protein BOX15_Mlig015194g2 [Macrostomum lignano]|uniref:Uncharacterized protein n=1 Tax=Macrostomum lignano TaxID=282301 RepID=A0A267DWE2_9PLAT|nr:hypothetical protein BOX15_Mlig015194g2 [Macrostomum lignano]